MNSAIRIGCSGCFTLALLGLAKSASAQQGPAAATQSSAAGPAGQNPPAAQQASWPPTREQWNQFLKQQQKLSQEVEELQKERAGAVTPPTQSQTATPGLAVAPPAGQTPPVSQSGGAISAGLGQNNIGLTLNTLFAPQTQRDYFTPMDIMNPEHMRPDMPMRIGQWEDLRLDMGLHTVGRFQALQQQNVSIMGVKQPGLNPGFQDPFADLSFLATIPNKLDVYADFYVASRPHPNTMYAHEGYMLFKQLPAPLDFAPLGDAFNYINIKVGAFDIDFGDGNYHRSNNAFVQRNPLIGNPLVDTNVEEIGAEVYSIKGPIYWLVGAGSGTTTEHLDYGAGGSGHVKIWAYPLPELRTSASFYYADLSGSTVANEHSDLFAAIRSGGTYSAVFASGDSPGQILPQGGERMMAAQGDVTWNHWPWELYANAGWTEDFDTNGTGPGAPTETWLYGTIGPVYHITPALYLAGRYSFAAAESVQGVDTSGWADRIEVGGGYWLTRSLLGKVEYVYEQYHNFSPADGLVSGVDAADSPRFNGLVLEVSFGF